MSEPDTKQTTEPGQYRIEAVDGGFEAQHLFKNGACSGETWQPLNAAGYWSDPDAYSFGLVSKRDVFATREEAASAIRKARAICGETL